MEMEELIEKLEERNGEYNHLLYSREYSRGVALSEYIHAMRICDLKKIKSLLTYKYACKKSKKYSQKKNDNVMIGNINNNYPIYNYRDARIVVYTCIMGEYDDIKEPIWKDDNIQYICFTNNKKLLHKKQTKWIIKDIPNSVKYTNYTLVNRYIKMHPHEFFIGYDYAIYIDANVKVCSYVGKYIDGICDKTGLAMYKHSARNSIYDEAMVCKYYGKGNRKLIDKQIKRYKNEGFPYDYGLYEATIIIIDLKNNISKNILEDWWSEFIANGSLRDQLSLPYVLWKKKKNFSDVGILGENIFEDKKISIYQHNK